MKFQLIAASMLLGTCLVAKEKQEKTVSCYPCPEQEGEKCQIVPEVCVDGVSYSPQFYNLQCDFGLFTFVDLFAWYARETNLPYGMQVTTQEVPAQSGTGNTVISSPTQIFYNKTSWNPGFRLGLGWNTPSDGWDFSFYWTYYHNKQEDVTNTGSTSVISGNPLLNVTGQANLINPWVNASFTNYFSEETKFDSISAMWKCTLNQMDLEIGKKYWVSRYFNFRPFASLRGAWTKTNFITNSIKNSLNQFINFQDEFQNRNWGVGFSAGIQPTWSITKSVALYAGVDGSLLWGKFKGYNNEFYRLEQSTPDINLTFSNKAESSFSQMMPMIDLAVGLRWEERWFYHFRTTFDLGWEHHIWFSHSTRIQTLSPLEFTVSSTPHDTFNSFSAAVGNLEYGGFVFRARFDF